VSDLLWQVRSCRCPLPFSLHHGRQEARLLELRQLPRSSGSCLEGVAAQVLTTILTGSESKLPCCLHGFEDHPIIHALQCITFCFDLRCRLAQHTWQLPISAIWRKEKATFYLNPFEMRGCRMSCTFSRVWRALLLTSRSAMLYRLV
jgi:hypothetical protein